mmetsp:Transcript_37861/g.99374  ORF Transcript_37861/g.99374 Transcript_37861/m.99374 type:complete len:258 (-) Transcript_37861:317-1090(-)
MLSIEPRVEARSQSVRAASSGSWARAHELPHMASSTTSHKPSEARTSQASCGPTVYDLSSGCAETPNPFRWRSPKARETARSPCTRQQPAKMTRPPAACTRARSSGRFGLWSSLSAAALPLRWTRTARESPRLATRRRRPPEEPGSCCSMQVMAVEPSGISLSFACLRNSASVLTNAAVADVSRHRCASPFPRDEPISSLSRLPTRLAWAHSAARLPPWPSNTAKKCVSPTLSAAAAPSVKAPSPSWKCTTWCMSSM